MSAVLQYQNDWDECLRRQAALLREGQFAEIEEKCRNAYSNPARQAAMRARAWKGARRVLRYILNAEHANALPQDCPFTWMQVRDDDYFG